jgi:GT2 family glycosyltransferase
MELAAGDFLALTDDDVLIEPDWFDTFRTIRARHPEIPVFCGRVLPEEGSSPDDYLNLVLMEQPFRVDHNRNLLNPGFCGANVFIERSICRRIGGFNPLFGPGSRFRNNDDGELAYRLIRAGVPILFSPELFVHHSGWRRESDNLALKSDYAFSLGALAGYYLRRGEGRLSRILSVRIASKLRRLVLGLALADRTRRIDGWIHVRHYLAGWRTGLLTPDEGSGNS